MKVTLINRQDKAGSDIPAPHWQLLETIVPAGIGIVSMNFMMWLSA